MILSSTGSGKTEAVHSQLLKWDNKSIFIQPMKTLATSIYNRLNNYHNIFGLDKWTIQHSSIEEDRFLSNKYCVTTIDQVLSGYLGMGRQSFIRGKNILLSNLIFDEVQLFEPDKTLLTTINMLDNIHKQGNKFIIMTATMPEYLINFLKNRFDMEAIICGEEQESRNVILKYKRKINFDTINQTQEKQIIICNTQKQQEYIYDNIKDKDRCIILNSKLLPTDREEVEKNVIKYFGKYSEDNNKILISTQVIEAGMDISANIMYSVIAPIDSLIQRAGRCTRWGGEGTFVVFELQDTIYDKNIIEATRNELSKYKDKQFTWKIQKQLVNNILNPFYEKVITNKELKKNKHDMKMNKRQNLIRDIQNINVIVSDTHNIDDFNKESISIHIESFKKIAENNNIYILHKKEIKLIKYKDIEIGDTVIIDGNSCVYDKLGFRYSEHGQCNNFTYIMQNENIRYTDYKYEEWISHANLVRQVAKEKLLSDKYNTYTTENAEEISMIMGLHDLGKLDELWQGKQWANADDKPLAHFPFKYGSNGAIFKDRNHAIISAYILKDYCDKIMFNVVLQHHKRQNNRGNGDFLKIRKYKLHNKSTQVLSEYGFNRNIRLKDENVTMSYNDVIKPNNTNWDTFLYLVGVLMESDIEAIKIYHEQ